MHDTRQKLSDSIPKPFKSIRKKKIRTMLYLVDIDERGARIVSDLCNQSAG